MSSIACEQQTHYRSSLLRRERSDDRKCVCCSQAMSSMDLRHPSCSDPWCLESGSCPRLGVLTIYMRKPDISVGKLNDSRHSATLFGKLLKIWGVIRGNAIFLLFLVCSAELVVLCNASFSHHVKFYSFMFMHNISIRVVCVNGKHLCLFPSSHCDLFIPLSLLSKRLTQETADTHFMIKQHDVSLKRSKHRARF